MITDINPGLSGNSRAMLLGLSATMEIFISGPSSTTGQLALVATSYG